MLVQDAQMAETGAMSNGFAVEIRRLDRWLVSIAVSICFSTIIILKSLTGGTLALPPVYDDVVYFQDAAARLHSLKTSGLLAFFQNYVADPPHSPMQSLLGTIGFFLFGLEPWAAVSMNTVFIILLMRIYLGAFNGVSFIAGVVLALGFLLHPFLTLLVLEFRPDPAAAILTTLGCAALILRSDDKKAAWIGGVFCGLALLSKTSTFYLTSLLFGVAFLLSSIEAALNKNWSKIVSRAWRLSVATVTLASVHYAFAAEQILGYIYTAIWGSTSALWKTPMPILDQMAYYLIGPGGRFGIGVWAALAPVVILIALAFNHNRSAATAIKDPILQLMIVLSVAWAFVSFSPIKTPFLGLSVPAFVLVISALSIHRICHARKHLALPLAAVMVVVGTVDLGLRVSNLKTRIPSQDFIASRFELLNKVADTLAARSDILTSTISVPIMGNYFNEANLAFWLQKRGVFNVTVETDLASVDPAAYKSLNGNFLVEITADNKDVIEYLPSGRIASDINAVIKLDTTLQKIASIPDRIRGGSINIYQKK